jgi:ABC-type enterochelin transport system substrate-binding protein
MKKKTAIDYFYDRVIKIFIEYHENDEANVNFSEAITEAFETAKVLEREYMMLMYNAGKTEGLIEGSQTAKEYFTETFTQ